MKNITVELSKDGIKEFYTYVSNIQSAFKSKDFMEFIAKKANETLLQVQSEKLITEDKGVDEEYRRSHKYYVNEEEIVLFNQATVPQSDMGEDYQQFYPNGFDLAKAVEYGTGIVGAGSEGAKYAGNANWQYDVRGHGYKGWFYRDKNGNKFWTNGYSGRLIYLTTKQRIEQNINSWVNEYVEKMQ